jgi:hypothetical protein
LSPHFPFTAAAAIEVEGRAGHMLQSGKSSLFSQVEGYLSSDGEDNESSFTAPYDVLCR